MKLTFIQAANGVPLVKNKITGDRYPAISEINSTEFTDDMDEGLEWMFEVLKMQAAASAALLTGKLDRPLRAESRAGHVTSEDVDFIMLDVDAALPYKTRDEFVEAIGIKCSYIFQHSASSTENDGLRGHYFVPLTESKSPRELKKWLKGVNFTHFKNLLTLSNNRQTLKWPLDIVVNDAGRVVYIAPPIQVAELLEERITLVIKEAGAFELPEPDKSYVSKHINSLRGDQSLNEIPNAGAGKLIDINPDEVKITGHKQNGKFGYMNLNGGDSWGYYYLLDNPEIVRNFKGEANFRLKDLDAELYESLVEAPIMSKPIALVAGTIVPLTPLVFRNPATDTFHQILHDDTDKVHKKYVTSGRTRLNDFMTTNGGAKPKEIPDWEVEFDPTKTATLDRKAKWFNLFEPTKYMLIEAKAETMPKRIDTLIKHLTVDEECYAHFINWIAFIYQFRKKTGTAWLFHGHTATGKGTLFAEVLRPIFGVPHSHTCTVDTAFEMFNSHMEQCLILFIDEFDISDLSDSSKAFNKLKNYITEEQINIRAMRSQQVQVQNFTNSILGTNSTSPIKIDDSDRRINFPPAQTKPLEGIQDWRHEIAGELEAFCEFLNAVEVNVQQARTTIKNKTRQNMVSASRSSHEDFFYAYKNGDIDFFLDNLLDVQPAGTEFSYARYEGIVAQWQDSATTEIDVSKESLMAVYSYVVAPKNLTALKFTAICKNNGVLFERRVTNSVREQVTQVTFREPENVATIPDRLPSGKVIQIR